MPTPIISYFMIFAAVPPEWTLVETAFNSIRDATAVFEVVGSDTKDPKTRFVKTGKLQFVNTQVYSIERLDISDGEPQWQIFSKCPGALAKEIVRGANLKAAPYSQSIYKGFSPYLDLDFPTVFFPWPAYLQLVDKQRETINYLGEESVNDLKCLKFEYRYFSFPTVAWICLERGGHVIREQKWIDEERQLLLFDWSVNHLAKIKDAEGKLQWFPTEFKLEKFNDSKKQLRERSPNYVQNFIFVPGTVKINTGLKKEDVEIKFDSRVEITGMEPEKPWVPRPENKRDVQSKGSGTWADLKKTLAEADAQKAMFDDRKRATPPDEAWPWVWIGGILTVAFGAAAVYFKMRHAA